MALHVSITISSFFQKDLPGFAHPAFGILLTASRVIKPYHPKVSRKV